MTWLLMNERYVAVFPSLVRLLGSLECAVLLQHIHWTAMAEGGRARVSHAQLSEETGISERTVRRRMSELRDGGWLAAERASSHDATLVYSVDVAKLATSAPVDVANLATSTRQPGGHVANLATSDVANLATSSIQKEEVPTSVGVEPSPEPHTGDLSHEQVAPVPQRHPSRPIDQWAPRSELLDHLRHAYPHVDIDASRVRFWNFHYAKQDTSKSWDALFENWVSNDEDRVVASLLDGTDDRGIPRSQAGVSSTVGPPLRPGDPGYFNPLD